MLAQRLGTALVLVPLVVLGLLYLPTSWLALVMAVVVLLGAFEVMRLCNITDRRVQWALLAAMTALLAAGWWLLPSGLAAGMQWMVSAWWLATTALLIARRRELPPVTGPRPGMLLLAALVLATAWLAVVAVHRGGSQGPVLVLFLFVLIWVADSFAYFAGRAFGRRKLSPFVSPGKTWAGAVGALLGAALAAGVLLASGAAGALSLAGLLGLSLLVTLVSIGGDLWESRLKREAGVKDSGTLLPGHGGVLDRIDSLLAAAPVFATGIGMLGGIR